MTPFASIFANLQAALDELREVTAGHAEDTAEMLAAVEAAEAIRAAQRAVRNAVKVLEAKP